MGKANGTPKPKVKSTPKPKVKSMYPKALIKKWEHSIMTRPSEAVISIKKTTTTNTKVKYEVVIKNHYFSIPTLTWGVDPLDETKKIIVKFRINQKKGKRATPNDIYEDWVTHIQRSGTKAQAEYQQDKNGKNQLKAIKDATIGLSFVIQPDGKFKGVSIYNPKKKNSHKIQNQLVAIAPPCSVEPPSPKDPNPILMITNGKEKSDMSESDMSESDMSESESSSSNDDDDLIPELRPKEDNN